MPPRRFSRYVFTSAIIDDDQRLYLTEPEPFEFQEFSDTTAHVVKEGDTLFSLAARYFRGLPRPAGLWWVIADFQPDPIVDPTVRLAPGDLLFIPSIRTVIENVFSTARETEATP